MRVTGNSITQNLVSQLHLLAARQARLQQQAASGQRVTAPEDDPAAMGRALDLQAEDSLNAQHALNISTLQNRANVSASALQALKKISDRASEIATLASAIQSPENLEAAGIELKQLIQEAVRLANSQDGDQFVFAGTRSDQPPFTLTTDSEGTVTAVTYAGNSAQLQAQIAKNALISVDAPGANSSGTGPRGVFSDSRYGADFFGHLISLQNHLLAGDTAAIQNVDRPGLLKDEDNIIFQTANNSVILARLETAAVTTEDQRVSLQKTLSNVAGADLTTTLVQLAQIQNSYQLAVQSSAKLLELQQSLFSALR
ncbi:MAG TPA: hypothetical protein VN673_11060 [Clostridia bacterium]|nr:hypothetical protein [Clostridia bacterium]